MAMRRLGQILVDLGFCSDEQLEVLLEEQQQRPGELIGKVAQDMSLITEEQLAQALAEQMGMQVINLADVVVPPEVLSHVTETMATLYRIIPVSFRDNTLTVAMCDPQKLSTLDELRNFLGFEVRCASNSQEMRAHIKTSVPDIILMDIMMPDADGISLTRELRADPKTEKIPILVVSGLADAATLNDALMFGADDFLTKPFELDALKNKLEAALRRTDKNKESG